MFYFFFFFVIIFDWIPDVLNFTKWVLYIFLLKKNTHELRARIQISYLEILGSFEACFLRIAHY